VKLAMAGAFDAPAAGGFAVAPRVTSGSAWKYAMAAAAGLAAGAVIASGLGREAAPAPADPVRVVLTTAADSALKVSPNALDVAISHDGKRVVYATFAAGGGLTARALNQLQPAMLLQNREGSITPFLSPDDAWLAFNDLNAGTIEKVPIDGGPPIAVLRHDAPLRGASWADDGTIVFGDLGPGGLFQVREGQQEPQTLTTPDRQRAETDHRWPHVLPGSRAVLFTRLLEGATARSEIALLDRQTGQQRLVIPEGTNPQYLSSGHLVYGVDNTLRAVPFDLSTLQVRGTPVPVLEGVISKPEGAVNFSLSPNGSLAYIMAPAEAPKARPVWVSRTGREEGALVSEDLTSPEYPRISPDGRRVALAVAGDIWVHELSGAPPTRLTTGGEYLSPVWSADGRRIVAERSSVGLAAIAADGSEEKTSAISVQGHFHPVALGRDGNVLAMELDRKTSNDARSTDIVRWNIDRPEVREDVVASPGHDGLEGAAVSPDGRWLAYVSHQTGQTEVWVRPYLGPGAPVRISPNGGIEPVWSRRGDELFYLERRRVMAVPVNPGSTFTFKPPTVLFESRYLRSTQPPSYDVAEDGRFLMIRPTPSQGRTSAQVVVVLNWAEELRRRVPPR
jgi:serine/threonine-protein kinase